MSEYLYAGLTSQTIDIFLQDSSSSTGQGLAGLLFNTASLVASYRKGATGSRVAITLATQTVGGAYSSGGFVEIDATHMKGVYRLDLPNAAVDTEGFVTLYLYGATNLLPTPLRIDCRAVPADVKKIGADAQSATDLKDFADAGYDPSTNKVQGVVLVDTTTTLTTLPTIPTNWFTADGLATDAIAEIADGVWDEPTAGHTTAGTYGGRIVRSTNSNVEVQITGSHHIAADVHEFQTGVIVAGAFAANAITAAALAADAVTEIQAGLATSAQITALNNITAASVVSAMGTGTFLTAVPWNAAWDAEVQSEMQDAIEVNHLDHLLAADYDPASKPGSATALLNELIGNDAGVSQFTANALELGPSGGGGGAGTGARTVTITVNDGTTALQNATVRMTEGANTFTAPTNASGIAVFNLDDATYTVGVTKPGYSYAGTTLIVNGTETATYSMTIVSVTGATNPALSAIEVLCLGADFEAESGIDVDFRMVAIATGDTNKAYLGLKVTVTSNGSGIARWEAPQGAVVEYKRGNTHSWQRVTLDADAATNVTSVIGSP